MTPDQFAPTALEDFIGPARQYAALARQMVREAQAAGQKPMKVLIHGDPGVGKSALVRFILAELGCDPQWSVTKLNGTELNMERLSEVQSMLRTRSLFGWRALWVDEFDAVRKNTTVQTRLLTLLDDLPPGTAVLCTSNCATEDFEKRVQSRFRPFEVGAPTPTEIAGLLRRWVDAPTASAIATACGGDVRMALNDAANAVSGLAMLAA